jgi:homocysteine S-methyltransferase
VEELNLKLAAMVRDVHRDYLNAGAQILLTNTFGANRIRLAQFDLETKVTAINNAGVRIAREVARDKAFVAGCIGPTGHRLAPLGSLTEEEAVHVFYQQAATLTGVDLYVLETFQDVAELRAAVKGVREAAGPDVVVIAHLSVEEDGRLADGTGPERYGPALNALAVDAIGLNCGSGPHALFRALTRLRAVTTKPLSAVPSCNGSPEYFAGCFESSGAWIAGGCCGTTPDHIRALARVTIAEPSAARSAKALTSAKPKSTVAFAERSDLAAKLAAKEFVMLADLFTADVALAKKLKKAGVHAVGLPNRTFMNTLGTACMIEDEADLETIVYTVARGRNARDLQRDLLATDALGVYNVLCVTGVGGGAIDVDSIGLTRIAHNLNRGLDLGGNELGTQTAFSLGVAVNQSAADLDREVARLEAKVAAGAEYAITQPVFDLAALERFLKRIAHLKLPVISTIWPLADFAEAQYATNECNLPVPEALSTRIVAGENVSRELVAELRKISAGLRITTRGGSIETAVNTALH